MIKNLSIGVLLCMTVLLYLQQKISSNPTKLLNKQNKQDATQINNPDLSKFITTWPKSYFGKNFRGILSLKNLPSINNIKSGAYNTEGRSSDNNGFVWLTEKLSNNDYSFGFNQSPNSSSYSFL